MRTHKLSLFAIFAILLAFIFPWSSRAEEARFFRISGPVASTITAISANGNVTWTNKATNATFTVQTIQSLSQTNWLDYFQVRCSNSITTHRIYDPNLPFGMALIPAGAFTMGDSLDGYELPLHNVYVSAFYMDKYEVTKALWDDVYNWAITHGYSFDNAGLGKAAIHPVQQVSWYDCVKWCNARSEKEGRIPAYYTSVAQATMYRSGQVTVDNSWVKWSSGYRLATEAEWEKAARGGASGHRFSWSDADTINQIRANYYSIWSGGVPYYPYDVNSTSGYHPMFNGGVYPFTSSVGYFAANGYGLYDMTGNVVEWCWDWYVGYSSVSQTDPRGPATGSSHVLRGGSWHGIAFECRTAFRYGDYPSSMYYDVGFRSVLPSGQ